MAPSIWSLPGGSSNALVKDSDHSFAPCQSFGLSSTRDELLNEVWGFENYPSTRTVDNHIATLRAKLENNPAEPQHLLTVHGVGYKLILIHTQLKLGDPGEPHQPSQPLKRLNEILRARSHPAEAVGE